MKKLLWTICFLSVGLNTYLIKFESKPPGIIEQKVDKLSSAVVKPTLEKQNDNCENNKKLIGAPVATTELPEQKDYNEEDSFDFDSFKKESSEKIDRFVLDELNLDLETSANIVRIFEEGQKKFDKYLDDKQKAMNPNGDITSYFFDAYDYIKMGRNRLETKKNLKTYLGVDSFKELEKFLKNERKKGGIAYEIL